MLESKLGACGVKRMTYCVVRTHPNSEKIAIHNLQRQDFDYYQPLILEKKVRRGKMQWVEQPLFPCYLFVKIVDRWRSLHSTYGVASLIGSVNSPSFVRESVIQSLRNREQNGYVQLPKPKMFEVGDKVTIQTGAFAGQQALVQRMPAKDRQKVLLQLLSNGMAMSLFEDDLVAA
jgi:transcriptional antiterminator RfaH